MDAVLRSFVLLGCSVLEGVPVVDPMPPATLFLKNRKLQFGVWIPVGRG